LTGLGSTDILLCNGASETLTFGFVGPETSETVTVTSITAGGGYTGLTVNSNAPGNPSAQSITLNGNVNGNGTFA
jgi:hypothetical protein